MKTITKEMISSLDSDVRSVILPIECLSRLKEDIIRFRETISLNGFQTWIASEGYVLEPPELPFEPKSIILLAAKHRLVNMAFRFGDRTIHDIYGKDRKELRRNLEQLVTQNGFSAQAVYWLPQKRLAVCAGLSEYGRNNITYTDGWGSFYELITYFSDVPAPVNYDWREVRRMDMCENCRTCLNNCPTKAIQNDTYLINNEICLTLFTESGDPFPDWLPKDIHHSIVGCFRCQEACPKNKGILDAIDETVEFDSEESELLLTGAGKDVMPQKLLDKISLFGLDDYRLKSFPKNLKALLEKETVL